MSQYPVPPSFDGQYNYAPPWPVNLPHDSSDPDRSAASFFAMGNAPFGIANFTGLPFGSVAPTHLPGLGMAPSATLMPYQPQQFAYDQPSIPFHGAFHSSFDAPNESVHSTPDKIVTKPAKKKRKSQPVQHSSKSPKHPPPISVNDTDREEGEVSDGSGYDSSRFRSRRKMHTAKITPAGPEISLSRSQSAIGADRSLSQSQTPPRNNSASLLMPTNNSPPYDPPVTLGMSESSQVKPKEPDASQVERRGHNQQSSNSQSSGKSPAQIRVMAQGALLSLAPHNIRFSDLVKENIDPTVLRQLYDDIGIKVTSAVPKPNVNQVKTAEPAVDKIVSSMSQEESAVGSSTSAKPLERKDVIARMLAEKAKKKATSVIADSVVNATISRIGSTSTSNIGQAAEVSKPQLPVQTKEKNKALSELARQRIEQLKKMGLKRQHSNSESTNVQSTPASSIPNTPIVKPGTAISLHHPLPERPPVAPSSPKPSTPQPHGSSLSSEPRDTSSPSIIDNRSMNTSTPFKNSSGKRPRASDFDEPIPEIKKHSMNDRLVIDISEDESSSGEEDLEMSEASDPAIDAQLLNAADGMPRAAISRNASSASGTSQSRASEVESLRQKNLEIQAMRRRIAELEEKNANKTRSMTPSATVNGDGSPSLANVNTETVGKKYLPIADKAPSLASPSEKPSPQRLQRSPSVQSLASMDNSDLDRIRQKLLRKRVIESGLPNLDAELMKFEAKLAEYKREEERLLSEIARSREERKKLGEELESLGMETEGLTLEELRAAKQDMERRTAVEAELIPHEIVTPETMLPSKTTQATTAIVDKVQVPQVPALQSLSPIPGPSSSEHQEVNNVADLQDLGSESSGSSMDESASSSASSSMDPDSDSEQEEAVEPSLGPSLPVAAEGSPACDIPQVEAAQSATLIPTFTSTEAPPVTTDPAVDVSRAADELNVSRASSVLSDNYEPPEPQDSDEAYSPKLSPKDIEDSEIDPAPELMVSNDADLTLTRKPQDFVVIASKGDALDNAPLGGETVPRFTPYQSPLKYFKAYRYHPNYVEEVKDGYRSLTYSHQIKSQQPFCPYEAAGGVCNDATCEFQHWRDIVMPDDKILVDLGNQREGKTTEEREAYIEGLKDLINSMQRVQVNDFPTVAGEIAAYRRRFLSDPSRILPL